MKTWRRATVPTVCGLCGEFLKVGHAILEYTIGRVRLIRCAECEGGGPPDLPLTIERQEHPLPPLNWGRLGLLPLDFKTRAAVEDEREPGEEG